MPIDLYYAQLSGPCRAVHMAIKQLNLQVNIKPLNLPNREHLKPEFLKINPAHCIPTIVEDDLTLWESRAIIQYLFNKYGPNSPFYPSDPKKRAVVDRFLYFDFAYYQSVYENTIMPFFRGVQPTEQQTKNFENNIKLLDTLIGQNKYLTGDQLTIADLSVLASTTMLGVNDYKHLDNSPNIKTWFERVKNALPYYEEVNGGVVEQFKSILAQKK